MKFLIGLSMMYASLAFFLGLIMGSWEDGMKWAGIGMGSGLFFLLGFAIFSWEFDE